MSAKTHTHQPDLSVIVGVQHGQANLPAILKALGAGADPGLEVLLCHAADDPLPAELREHPGIRPVRGRADALIPELWRDGIMAARADRVGLLSAHCIPDADWTAVARGLDLTRYVAYGGTIGCADDSGAADRAVHLLRYAAFTELPEARETAEIAADNAIYDRAAILACGDLLPLGFWEPSYHARFRARGLRLALAPKLRVIHKNRYAPRVFMRQRRLHGRAFGRARATGASSGRRWLMLVASPAVFPVFAAKQSARIWRDPAQRRGFLRVAPWFYAFMANWSLGEMGGYADAALGRVPCPPAGSAWNAE